jgi:hypothetical protein
MPSDHDQLIKCDRLILNLGIFFKFEVSHNLQPSLTSPASSAVTWERGQRDHLRASWRYLSILPGPSHPRQGHMDKGMWVVREDAHVSSCHHCEFFFFFFGSTMGLNSGLHTCEAGALSMTWVILPALFALVIFEIKSLYPSQPGRWSSYLCFPV